MLIVTSASLAGVGTFATWTSTATRTHDITSGSVAVTVANGDASNAFSATVTDFVPGDYIDRLATVTNSGTTQLASITLAVSATNADSKNLRGSLTFTIDTCSAAWAGSTPGSYTCSGTTTSVASGVAYGSLAASYTLSSNVAANGISYARVRATLPSTVTDSNLMGAATTVTYTFTGTQRNGTAK